jgi:hypothetical protein
VDHDADLPVGQPERLRRRAVEDLLHRLHLQEVVPGAQAADLVQAAVDGPATDLGRVGTADNAVVLAPVQVTLAAVAVRHRVGGPAQQQLFQLAPAGQLPHPAAPGAARDRGGELIHHPAEHRGQLAAAEVRGEQADAAGDVETDAAACTMPGSSATLATCCRERSAAGSGISARVANTMPGTRIRPCRAIANRYGDSSAISTSPAFPGAAPAGCG